MSKNTTAESNLRDQLHQLITSSDFRRLEEKLAPFNVLQAAGVKHQELRHSDFLASFMRPDGSHGLGDRFLRAFLLQSIAEIRESGEEPRCHPLDIDLVDLSRARVEREWSFSNLSRNVDLLVHIPDGEFGLESDQQGLVVVIENKIKAGESGDQLRAYLEGARADFSDCEKLFLYLTPEGELPNEEVPDAFYAISYTGTIIPVLEQLAGTRSDTKAVAQEVPERVKWALDDYLTLLRRHVVDESEVGELCNRILREHHEALERLWEHRESPRQQLLNEFEQIVAELDDLTSRKRTTSKIECVPIDWYNRDDISIYRDETPVLSLKLDVSSDGSSVALYFRIVNAGSRERRQRVWERACENDNGYYKDSLSGELDVSGKKTLRKKEMKCSFEEFREKQQQDEGREYLKDRLQEALKPFRKAIFEDMEAVLVREN